MNRVAAIALAAAMLALGTLLGIMLAAPAPVGTQDDASADTSAAAGESADSRQVAYWYDPMVPDQHFDKPGKSPFMDMMLVPRYVDPEASEGVRIAAGVQQNLGIRTAAVRVGALPLSLRVPGTLQWNLRAEHRVSARVNGIVERLQVRAPFERVRRGEALATLLAPELAGALAEYRALSAGESEITTALLEAARSRLMLFGLSDADLRQLAATGTPRIVLRAPIDALVAEINVREGETVLAGQSLFRLNGIDPIWLEARVPQADAAALAAGTPVRADVSAFPGEVFEGEVEALLPDLDTVTRTVTARIVLSNPEAKLIPGMFAEAQITPTASRRWPLLPNEALILTGRAARVIVKDADGGFRPVAVRTGRHDARHTEILEGLDGGEQVVLSGQFLIDSEASLSGLLSRLESAAPDSSGHDAHQPVEEESNPAEPRK